MSRTEFAQSQNHLRNRSSTSRFGYQSQVQSSNSTPFLEGGSGGGEKQRFSTPYDVSEEDRSKFRSFKFPRKTSILSGHSGSGYMRVDLSTPSLSDFPCDTSSSNAIPFQNQHYDHGLPTPPPSASGSDHHHLLDESLKSVTHFSPAVPQPLLPQRFKKQYRHLNDSYSTAKNASVDLRNMEETFLEDSFGSEKDWGRGRESIDTPSNGSGWYAYRWPSQSHHHSQCEPPSASGSPRRKSHTKNLGERGGSRYNFTGGNTFRIKRGVVFTRGLPSTTVIRMLLWGSWVAMVVLVALAVLFIYRM